MTRPKQERIRIVVRTAYDVWMTPEPGKRSALIKKVRAAAETGGVAFASTLEGTFSMRRAKK